MNTLHIGMAAPVAHADVAHLLDGGHGRPPTGYPGAPLIATLIESLLARGHRVTAYTLSADLPLKHNGGVRLHGRRFTLHCLPMRPRAWPFNGWRTGRIVDLYGFERAALERAIQASAPDVVHAHWAYEFAWATLATGRPHVITSHDSPFLIARFHRGFKLGGYRRLRALMAWNVLRQAARVTAVSPYMVDQVQPLCRVPVAMVPNPLGLNVLRHRRGAVHEVRRIVMVSNGLDERKNTKAGLLAYAAAAARHPELELLALGAGLGPEEEAHRWWRQQQLQGRITFAGAQPHARVLNALRQSDLLLHPALEESFGVVLAEAMAIGVPVVAGKDSGAVPWVVGEAGHLVDVSRVDGLQQGIEHLVDHPAEARRLAERAQETILWRFGADAVAEAYEAQYAQCR